MKRGTDGMTVGRRGFLGAVSAMAAAAAALVAGARPAAASESDADKRKARYRRTPHVEAFYRTAGYETRS